MAEPILYEHELTGHPETVIASLCRSVGQYARRYERFYVGRTKDPKARMAAHRRKWASEGNVLCEMVTIYRTKSFANMVRIEARIIEHVKAETRQYVKAQVLNKRYGDWEESDAFYLYLLVDDGTIKRKVSDTVEPDPKKVESSGLATSKMDTIRKKIRELGDDSEFVYVGFTDDPVTRFRQHQDAYRQSQSWSKMIVLFKGRNLHDTYVGENQIIDYALKRYGDEKCLNASLKYDLESGEYYYVYVALGNGG